MAERPEDFNLPLSVVTKIIKEALPDGVNVSKEARAALSKAASVFVLYATSVANNHAMKSKKKTLSGADVISAMEEMEFGKFVVPLQESLQAFREEKTKKETAKGNKKDKSGNNKDNSQDASALDEEDNEVEELEESVVNDDVEMD